MLDLAHTKVSQVPPSLSQLLNLQHLDLSHCSLRELREPLPATISKLQLNDNEIEYIGDQVFSRVSNSLRTLDLSKNKLSCLPSSFSDLSVLQIADLRYNRLEVLGSLLPASAVLDQVLLGFNSLTRIDDVGLGERCPALSVLMLNDNKISALPEEQLVRCAELKMLEIGNNNIADLPAALGYMPKLQGLNAIGNPLRGIRFSILQAGTQKLKAYLRTRGPAPPSLAAEVNGPATGIDAKSPFQQLLWSNEPVRDAAAAARSSGILRLDQLFATNESQVAHDNVQVLLSAFAGVDGENLDDEDSPFRARPLQHLGLSGNPLGVVPRCLASRQLSLDTLLCLELGNVGLSELPLAALASCCNLEKLVARKNRLVDAFSDALAGPRKLLLTKLKHLDLRENQMVEFPQVVLSECHQLEDLLLGFNNISRDDGRLGQLRSLKTLDLSNNRLPDLPQAILAMPMLEFINLENNACSSVPYEVATLPRLRTLLLSGNPQRVVRPHIVAEGSAAVLAYLKDRCTTDQLTAMHKDLDAQMPTAAAAALRIGESRNGERAANRPDAENYSSNAGGFSDSQHKHFASQPSSGPKTSGAPATPRPEDIAALDQQIAEMEDRLENDFSLSGTQRATLRRDLAKGRAARSRMMTGQVIA